MQNKTFENIQRLQQGGTPGYSKCNTSDDPVSSKYMNGYSSLFVFMHRYADMDDNEMTGLLIRKIKWFHCHITRDSLKNSHLFSGYADIVFALDQAIC